MKVPQCNPGAANIKQRDKILEVMTNVLDSGWYILGKQVRTFETEFARFCGSSFCLGVASGTDALELALRALNLPPDAKIATVAFTASATGAAIRRAGLSPVFVDIDENSFTMSPEALIKTLARIKGIKAVIPVHLYGHPADMVEILNISKEYELPVIEDCAQAHGAEILDRRVGTWGIMGCFSFYPTKNLGGIGDGGAITTSDAKLHEHLGALRQYGWHERFISSENGINSRLDELQAAILSIKLEQLENDNIRRREIAEIYNVNLKALPLALPTLRDDCCHVYHQYVIQCDKRDALMKHMEKNGIGCSIHYPQALHTQPAFTDCEYLDLENTETKLKTILSLPMYPELTDVMVEETIIAARKFFS